MTRVFAGTNSYMLRSELRKIITAFVSEYDEIGLEQLDGEEVDYARIQEALQSLPFLAPKKLVVLRSPSVNQQYIENVETLLSDVSDSTDVIIVEPKVDKRTAYYKWLKKQMNFQEFNELDENSLARWTVEYAKEQGGVITASDARYLINRVGYNQERLANEITKLIFAGDKITKQVIDEMTAETPQSKIFDLLDAAFNGQTKKALAIYREQRQLKVEPQEIIGMLGWQLRQISLAKTVGSHDLIREGKVSPYGANKASKIAGKLTTEDLKKRVSDLTAIDARSKCEPIDLDEALQNYILHLA
jgi:DNA polymerase-3 subunit delta